VNESGFNPARHRDPAAQPQLILHKRTQSLVARLTLPMTPRGRNKRRRLGSSPPLTSREDYLPSGQAPEFCWPRSVKTKLFQAVAATGSVHTQEIARRLTLRDEFPLPAERGGSGSTAIELSIGTPSVRRPLPARNERGEGWGEGKSNKNATPLPGPLLLLRRKRGRRARSIPLIQCQWGQGEGCLGNTRSFPSNGFKALPSPRPSPRSFLPGRGRRGSAACSPRLCRLSRGRPCN
jgi:hypothetical protein